MTGFISFLEPKIIETALTSSHLSFACFAGRGTRAAFQAIFYYFSKICSVTKDAII